MDEVGVLVQLDEPIDFDAPDKKPVDFLAFLLVSGDANQAHLDALAKIAEKLSNPDQRSSLRSADSGQSLYEIMTS